MARNGSGVYSLPQAPFVSGTTISSTAVNSDFSDIATALTQSIASDGQTPITANLPMSGYKHTGVANATARTDYAATGQVQDGAFTWCGTAGGTADALTLTPTPAITAYATGMKLRFKAGASPNTGATTIAVSGLATKAAQLNDAALVAGDIAAGKYYEVLYDGTAFQLTRISGSAGSPASETVAGIIEIATAAETTTGTDDTRAITPKKLTEFAPASVTADVAADELLILDASDSSKVKRAAASGIVAAQSDMETATSTALFVTPGRQRFHPAHPKAWVNFNGTGTVAIREDYQVSSITDNGTGDYTVNFDVNFANTNYICVANADRGIGSTTSTEGMQVVSVAVGAFRMLWANATPTPTDQELVMAMFIGDQ